MIDYFIISFFAIWLVASIFSQASKPVILKYDILGILPTCRFFAPRPIAKDVSLFAKAFSNNSSTAWKPLCLTHKKWWCFVWNPQHRLRKIIGDLLRQIEAEKDTEFIYLSLPYLTILNSATTLFSDDKSVKSIQFMLTCYAGYEDSTNEIVFISNVHRV